eukprot:1839-Eustigmatos_ZCMA.PRE.1
MRPGGLQGAVVAVGIPSGQEALTGSTHKGPGNGQRDEKRNRVKSSKSTNGCLIFDKHLSAGFANTFCSVASALWPPYNSFTCSAHLLRGRDTKSGPSVALYADHSLA